MIKKACSVTKAGKIRRKFLAVLCLLSLAGPSFASKVDLSPKTWRAGELEIYNWLDKQFGMQNVLAEGKNGVITGTTSASARARRARSPAPRRQRRGCRHRRIVGPDHPGHGQLGELCRHHDHGLFDAGSGQFYNLNAGFNTVGLARTTRKTIPAHDQYLVTTARCARSNPSGRTALVPGYMAGVQAAHEKFGKLAFKDLFAPAIYYAENGFELTPFHAGLIKLRRKVLSRLPETKAIFTKPDGSWYGEGDLFKQPDLAATLRRIGGPGRGLYVYRGVGEEVRRGRPTRRRQDDHG